MQSIMFSVKDWWASRKDARPAPDELARVINESSHSASGRTATSPSDRAMEQMAEGADDYLKSFE